MTSSTMASQSSPDDSSENIQKIQELTALTLSIQKLKDALKNLTKTCSKIMNKEDLKSDVTLHEALAEVLDILKHMLTIYPVLQSTEILMKAQNLVHIAQGISIPGKNKDIQDSIDELAIVFSIRVSEYVLGASGEIDLEFTPNINVKKTDRQVSTTSSAETLTTFGVGLEQHLKATGTTIPHLVTKCVQEIDDRGILIKAWADFGSIWRRTKALHRSRYDMNLLDVKITFAYDTRAAIYEMGYEYLLFDYISSHASQDFSHQGIYRVSGVKSKVEKLCQEFETYGCSVNLSDVHPNVIANVLKLYLRQLPQPLFTFQLYHELIRLAKVWPCNPTKEQAKQCIEDLHSLLSKLPKCHYGTAKYIMQHLKRVSDQNETNNMSPGNLGIVFGPTVLRSKETRSCLNSLLDTVHQSRIVELIITYAPIVFTNLRKASNS